MVAFGGCPPGTWVDLDPNAVHYRCIRLVGSYRYPTECFDQALDLLVNGAVDTTPLLGHELPLKNIAAAPREAARTDVPALLISA
ncbi:hypothetical protein [Streptomyces sp. GS7]|uniref:hypothetical protein n=1 Tax=Streptomyces sp. GS7 TaxID=2692234 RepID=UPI001317E71B|nr:hypothetical protein [Streptomyces sp. GS7]QHC24536.1 hypothetical protein GR130_27350 [Streptomyces sp. GS7]